jgi:hypothetical protein
MPVDLGLDEKNSLSILFWKGRLNGAQCIHHINEYIHAINYDVGIKWSEENDML